MHPVGAPEARGPAFEAFEAALQAAEGRVVKGVVAA
jgi:hypothetical protein